jgi:magnesium-transporting ATPase (P-type)
MNTSLAQFMKIAVTAIAISALLFIVGYKMIDTETTGAGGYKTTIEGVTIPTTAIPSGTR